MRRVTHPPREGWQDTVRSQGLVWSTTHGDDGIERPWWYEQAHYELTLDEVEVMEAATDRLHRMCIEAARFLATGAMGTIGLSPLGFATARESFEAFVDGGAPSLYGRFDLRYDGTGTPKLLEYNADTPTGLLEASVVQWFWLEDLFPALDQWNSLHERLMATWQQMSRRLEAAPIWFAHHEDEPTGEDLMTVTYLRDTADQAGLVTRSTTLGEIGWDDRAGQFLGRAAGRWEPMRTCFALYPWETMLAESFGAHVEARPNPTNGTTWIEPPWKALLSNKALLAALWHLYPDDDLLLPAYLDGPHDMDAWVAKPLFGREGDNIRVRAPGIEIDQPGDYGDEGWCHQQWSPLPTFDGNKAVMGCWVVDGHAAGLGIRESDGWVTDYGARFVPHVITADRPDFQTRAQWIAEDL